MDPRMIRQIARRLYAKTFLNELNRLIHRWIQGFHISVVENKYHIDIALRTLIRLLKRDSREYAVPSGFEWFLEIRFEQVVASPGVNYGSLTGRASNRSSAPDSCRQWLPDIFGRASPG